LDIYEPYCVKKDEKTGNRVKIQDFKIFEIKVCKEYMIEYVLMNDYSGNLSFQRKDAKELLKDRRVLQTRREIYDSRNNIVDFTKLSTYIFFDSAELRAKARLQATKAR
jgi:hypothetical protein